MLHSWPTYHKAFWLLTPLLLMSPGTIRTSISHAGEPFSTVGAKIDPITGEAKMDLQAALTVTLDEMLATVVSIAVRNESVMNIIKGVRTGGFTTPIELRRVPVIPVTLTVYNVTAENVLTATALLSGC